MDIEEIRNLKGLKLIQAEYQLRQEMERQMRLDIQNETWNSLPPNIKEYMRGQYRLAHKRHHEQGLIDKEYSFESASINGEIKLFEKLFGKHNLTV